MIGFALLWLFSLAAALLLVATTVACAARYKSRWAQYLWLALPIPLPILPSIAAVLFSWWMYSENYRPRWLLAYSASWLVAFAVGMIVTLRLAQRRRGAEQSERWAASWPRGTLFALLILAVLILIHTVFVIDRNRRPMLSDLRAEAIAKIKELTVTVAEQDKAGPMYEKAYDILKNMPNWTYMAASSDTDIGANVAKVKTYLQQNQRALDLLRAAATKPHWGVQVDPSDPWPSSTSLVSAQQSVNLLVLDARLKAANGDGEGAVANIGVIRVQALHLHEWPGMIGTAIAIAIDESASLNLEMILAESSSLSDGFVSLPIPVNADIHRKACE